MTVVERFSDWLDRRRHRGRACFPDDREKAILEQAKKKVRLVEVNKE